MSEQRSGATADAEESATNSEVAEQTSTEQAPGSFAAALLAAAKDDGHQIGLESEPAAEEPTDKAEPEVEPTSTEEEQSEEIADAQTTEEQTPPAAETDTGKKSIEAQIAEYKSKGEKPPWYLSRIAEESQKRRERTEDLRKAEARVRDAETELQQLRAQVSQTSAPAPTPQNPLADIYDESGLQKVEASFEKMLEFAEKNRDGAEDVVVGKDDKGNEIRKDFTPEEIASIRYNADKALRKDIPMRRQYLVARAKADAAAMEIYPEFQDSTSDMTKEALGILRAAPQLETLLGPEVLVWIGHALKGREAFLSKNGKTATKSPSTAAEKIVRASKTTLAPTPTKSRALPERPKGADLTAASKNLKERGDEDSATEYVDALLSKRRSGGVRKLEPVAE